jgi:hypothetical protein
MYQFVTGTEVAAATEGEATGEADTEAAATGSSRNGAFFTVYAPTSSPPPPNPPTLSDRDTSIHIAGNCKVGIFTRTKILLALYFQ